LGRRLNILGRLLRFIFWGREVGPLLWGTFTFEGC
jgi:hypothetical protein